VSLIKPLIVAILLTLTQPSNAAKIRTITLTPKNAIFFVGDIMPESVAKLGNKIIDKAKWGHKVYVLILSPGGQVFSLKPLVKQLRGVRNVEVIVIRAASMAAALVQSLPYKRLIIADGLIMFHEVAMVSDEYLTEPRLEELLADLRVMNANMALICAKHLNISLEQYRTNIRGKDWELTAPDALQVGAVDEIVFAECNEELRKDAPRVQRAGPMPGMVELVELCDLL
jgi:ATP-dependent protease ClpP protease subunit